MTFATREWTVAFLKVRQRPQEKSNKSTRRSLQPHRRRTYDLGRTVLPPALLPPGTGQGALAGTSVKSSEDRAIRREALRFFNEITFLPLILLPGAAFLLPGGF